MNYATPTKFCVCTVSHGLAMFLSALIKVVGGHCFIRIQHLWYHFETFQQFENALLAIGDILEALVMSQKRQLQLSVKVSPDLIQLVKRFHQRWNELKQKVEGRHSAIDKAMVKYDPVNLGVAGRSCDNHVLVMWFLECIFNSYILCRTPLWLAEKCNWEWHTILHQVSLLIIFRGCLLQFLYNCPVWFWFFGSTSLSDLNYLYLKPALHDCLSLFLFSTRVHNSAQWHHPELSELYNKLKTEHTLSSYPSSAYPIALKLRAIQKRTQRESNANFNITGFSPGKI